MPFRESFENSLIPSQEEPKEIEFVNELSRGKEYIDISELKKIGEGETHDVFTNPQNQEFVIKLDKVAFDKAINLDQAELTPESRETARQYINKKNEEIEQLYKYFGKEHCLQETVMIQKMRVKQNNAPKNIEGVISIQESSNIFDDPNKKDFGASYTEQDPQLKINKEAYDRMNKALLADGEFNAEDFLVLNEKIKSIFELVDKDSNFKNSLKEFLLRFKDYHEATDNFIDLVGKDNVLFNQKDGNWNFTLGSVVKGDNMKTIQEAVEILDKEPETLNQNEYLSDQLMNGLAISRLLNATGLKVGIGKVIDFQLSEKQIRNLEKINFKKNKRL